MCARTHTHTHTLNSILKCSLPAFSSQPADNTMSGEKINFYISNSIRVHFTHAPELPMNLIWILFYGLGGLDSSLCLNHKHFCNLKLQI